MRAQGLRKSKAGGWVSIMVGLLSASLLGVPSAGAATVVNGDFESGALNGWKIVDQGGSVGASWFAYSGTENPLSGGPEPFPPPQGKFAAISDQNGGGTHILYQDIALEPGVSHNLSMLVFYKSVSAIAIPDPDTLSFKAPSNQQYRVDVIRPGAPVDSVSAADVLATVFRTAEGEPTSVEPTPAAADLTAFAGQTVRLRLAEVDNTGQLNAGADAISITSVLAPVVAPPLSNAFSFGKLKLNKKKGTGKLEVILPGPGILTAVDVRSLTTSKTAAASKNAPIRIKKTRLEASTAETVKLNLKPTAAGRRSLEEKGKLSFKLQVTFTPAGGTATTQPFKGNLKLKRG